MALGTAITNLEELKGHPAIARLQAWNASAVQSAKFDRDEMTIYVDRANIRDVCALLRDDAECAFNFLSDVTCVDWYPAEPRFEVVYHLYSLSKNHRLRLKVGVEEEDPRVPSVIGVWKSANWMEREAFDLYGIVFDGHPDLRRIFLEESFPGHPLRKSFLPPRSDARGG